MQQIQHDLVTLDSLDGIWEKFFTVFPLVVIGTRDQQGVIDLAPKHMSIPLSWQNHYGFVCTPSHKTYQNIQHSGEFTVTYPRPTQVVLASLAASPREDSGDKPITEALPTFPASEVKADFLRDGYLYLECRLQRIIDDFGRNSLICGEIVQVHVADNALRSVDTDDQQLLQQSPLLSYLYPGRFSSISDSLALPFPQGFRR